METQVNPTSSTYPWEVEPKRVQRKRQFLTSALAPTVVGSLTSESESSDLGLGSGSEKSNDSRYADDAVLKSPPQKKRLPREVKVGKDGLLKCNVSCRHHSSNSESDISLTSSHSAISVAATVTEQLMQYYFKNREKIIDKKGFISTPLHVLKTMAEQWKTPFHAEVFSVDSKKLNPICRVEIFCGKLRGIGQSCRRKLSFQVAAADLLIKMMMLSKVEIQPYAFLPGFLVNPSIYFRLCRYCDDMGLAQPVFKLFEERPYEQWPVFVIQCRVGRFSVTGESDSRFLAKRLAAKEMFEALSHEIVPDDDVAMGGECFGLKELREIGTVIHSSDWKQEWMTKNRFHSGRFVVEGDEPDDDMIEELDDMLESEILQQTPVNKTLVRLRGASTDTEASSIASTMSPNLSKESNPHIHEFLRRIISNDSPQCLQSPESNWSLTP